MSTRVAEPASTPTAQPAPGGRRGLALLLALLTAGTAVLLGADFWISASGDDDGAFVLIAVHATAGVLALSLALSLGQLEVHRPSGPADGPRPRWVALRVWAAITGATAVVAAAGALITGVPAWIAVGLLAGLVGMAGASWLIGHRTRVGAEAREAGARASGAPADPLPGLDWTPALIRRKILTIVSVGLLGVLVGAVVLLLLLDEFDDGFATVWPAIVQLGAASAAVTTTVVMSPLHAAVASIVRDLSRADRKRVGRRTSGKGEPLPPRLEHRAARLAAVSRISQRFQLVASSLIVVVSVVTLLQLDLGGSTGGFRIVAIVLGVGFLAFLPYVVIDDRRRSRYAASTRELARSVRPQGTDTVGA